MLTLLISSSGTSSNISTDNSDSDSTDDEVPLQDLSSTGNTLLEVVNPLLRIRINII